MHAYRMCLYIYILLILGLCISEGYSTNYCYDSAEKSMAHSIAGEGIEFYKSLIVLLILHKLEYIYYPIRYLQNLCFYIPKRILRIL